MEPVTTYAPQTNGVVKKVRKVRSKKEVAPMTSQEVAAAAKELQKLQRQRAIVIKSRNMQANRIQAIVAGSTEIGYSAGLSESDRMKKFGEATELINAVVAGEKDHDTIGQIIRTTMKSIDEFNYLKKQFEDQMEEVAKKLPIAKWVNHPDQRCFGHLFLAIVIGETGDLANYENPAKVWRRMGCAPYTFDGQTHMGSTWRFGKEGKLTAPEWEKFGYSPRRRSIAYLIGEGIVKQNGKDSPETIAAKKEKGLTPRLEDGPYKKRYTEAKEKAMRERPEWSTCSLCKGSKKTAKGTACTNCKGTGKVAKRCHMHAMLLATKLLLKVLWCEWNGNPKEDISKRTW